MCAGCCVLSLAARSCLTLWEPMDCPLSMEVLKPRILVWWRFSRQEYLCGLPCLSPRDLPNPGIEPRVPALQVNSLPSDPPGKPNIEKWTDSKLGKE